MSRRRPEPTSTPTGRRSVTGAPRRARAHAPMGIAVPVLAALAFLTGPSPSAAQTGLPVGAAAEPVVLETLDGEPVDLGEILGTRPMLIEFWATWCAVCRALEPEMTAAYEAYSDQVEFLVVAAAVAQTQEGVKRHLNRHPPPGRVLWDTRGRFTRAYDAPGTGWVVMVDADGTVAYTGTGPRQDLRTALADLVARR